jgi:GTPase SAR1 family protein
MSSFELDLSSLDIAASTVAGTSICSTGKPSPVCVLVIGMAGSGKSTLMHRINLEMIKRKSRAYYINLDPATTTATGERDDICSQKVFPN